MKILAWIDVFLIGFVFLVEPFLRGKKRSESTEFYTYKDWLKTWFAMLLYIPLCGRILGWW